MAGVGDPESVMRASESASTKVKESVDSEELLVFSNSKVVTVDSDRVPADDDWERRGCGKSTGLVTVSSSVTLSGLVEQSPFVEPMA